VPAALSALVDGVVDWWRNWLHLTVLNLVWTLSWFLIVLGPPVTLAAYAYVHRLVGGDEMTPAEFARAVRATFWQAWAWAVAALLPVVALAASLVFYARFPGVWARSAEVGATLLVLAWLVVQCYALPYLFVQERRSLALAYRNAILTLLASPLHALLFALVLTVLLALSLRFMAVTFLVSPVLVAMLGTHAVRERLARFGVGVAP
jgi:uncharacterized membrane protein YesL